jgi:hypothetical protein
VTVHQRGFGIPFVCDEAVPGLAPGRAGAPRAVRIRLHRTPPWLDLAAPPLRTLHPPAGAPAGASALRVSVPEKGWLSMAYADGTRFVLDEAGTQVWAAWPAEATLEDTATYLLGPVAALLLRLRGSVPLHASAVALDGAAVALAGPAGAGKSTAAAAFARAGHRVLGDDVLALEERDGVILAHPAYPRLRLWPDSVAALFGNEDALPRLTPGWEKRYLEIGGGEAGFPADPLPVRAVYLLSPRAADGPAVRPLAPREGLLRLLATTCATFVPGAELREREFRLLGRLAREVPLRALTPPDTPGGLAELCRAVAADARSLP